MEWLPTIFAMILGGLLRIAVPILVTALRDEFPANKDNPRRPDNGRPAERDA